MDADHCTCDPNGLGWECPWCKAQDAGTILDSLEKERAKNVELEREVKRLRGALDEGRLAASSVLGLTDYAPREVEYRFHVRLAQWCVEAEKLAVQPPADKETL